MAAAFVRHRRAGVPAAAPCAACLALSSISCTGPTGVPGINCRPSICASGGTPSSRQPAAWRLLNGSRGSSRLRPSRRPTGGNDHARYSAMPLLITNKNSSLPQRNPTPGHPARFPASQSSRLVRCVSPSAGGGWQRLRSAQQQSAHKTMPWCGRPCARRQRRRPVRRRPRRGAGRRPSSTGTPVGAGRGICGGYSASVNA